MINETNIICFLSVCDTLNFTESARRLFLTQQAVSKNIMQLENDCGLILLKRGSRSVALTREGELYRDLLLKVQQIYQEDIEQIHKLTRSYGSTIDISCQNAIDLGAGLTRAVRRMKNDFPDINVRVNRFSPGELTEKLYKSTTDIAILYNRYAPENPEYERIKLFRTGICLLVSCENDKVKEGATYLDFINEPYIIDIFQNENEKLVAQRASKEAEYCGLEPKSVITVPNRESAYHSAAMNSGVLIGTEISRIPPEFGLVSFRTDSSDSVVCIFRKNAVGNIRGFANLLADEYGRVH